ncbi:MAG: HD domain-containing protein [Patescibacteria group bacterium]
MKKDFKKIWELALPYQDKRDDDGHAKIVTEYAIKLCKLENINDFVVVPAAILHDIGWSQLTKKDWQIIFDPKKTPEAEYIVRIKHQDEGVKLAEKILLKADYPLIFLKPILEIISQHDTRKNFFSNEDAAMRDADKLWRYSKTGFGADLRRNKFNFDFLYNKRLTQINEKNFLFFKSAKNIARKELFDRKKIYERKH